jgi:hypothetical protein
MCECFGKLFFTILTLGSIGVTTAVVVALFVVFQINRFNLISDSFNIGLIVSVCVSVVIFCFAIYASCCGKTCSRVTLGLIYLVYAAALATLAGLLFGGHDKLLDETEKLWTGTPEERKVAGDLEEAFDCKCWNASICLNQSDTPTDPPCQKRIKDAVEKYWHPMAVAFVVFAVVMLVGMVVAFVAGSRSERTDGYKPGIQYESVR